MFRFFLVILSFYLLSLAAAQSPSFEDRIQSVDQYVAESQRIQKEVKELKLEIEGYKSPKMIKKDGDVLSAVLSAVNISEKEVSHATYFVETVRIKKELAELKAVMKERETYVKNQKKYKELERNQAYSKRLNQYIESIKSGKHNQSRAIYFTLNDMEKSIAEDFEKTNSYLIREKHMQESLDQEIAKSKSKIEKSLFYPEDSISKIKKHEAEMNIKKNIFQQLKDEHALIQYDFKFETWSLGLFNCESKAEYQRLTNFPDMLMLRNSGSLMSVIKLDPANPKTFEIIYHCNKPARFGGCLDDEKKELCRLDSSCFVPLTEMESVYNRNEFFLRLKSTMPAMVLTERLNMYRDKDKFNFLKAMADSNKLGYFNLEELYSMMEPIIELSKGIQAKTPEEYNKKIKLEIEKNRKKVLDSISKKASPKPSATKIEETKTAVNYVFTAMATELEVILNDDFIQERTYQECSESDAGCETFCRASAEWRNKVKIFNGTEEIQNLVPGECPRAVFRFK